MTTTLSSLVGGLTAQGRLRFNLPATSGTGSITLSSSDGSVTVPSSISPVVGSTAVWFPILTSSTATSKTVTITATQGSISVQTNVTLLPATALSSNAKLVGTDWITEGSWEGVYGGDGYNILGDASSYPSYASLSVSGETFYQFVSTRPLDARCLIKTTDATDRQVSCWTAASSFTLDLTLTGGVHRIGLYFLDFELAGRTQQIDILDATSGDVIDSQIVSDFTSGVWLFWNLSGHVQIQVTLTGGINAVLSAITFDAVAVPPTPTVSPSRLIAQGASLGRMMGIGSDGTPFALQYHTKPRGTCWRSPTRTATW